MPNVRKAVKLTEAVFKQASDTSDTAIAGIAETVGADEADVARVLRIMEMQGFITSSGGNVRLTADGAAMKNTVPGGA